MKPISTRQSRGWFRIFFIDYPLKRVVCNIRSDTRQVRVVADDVVVKASLPFEGCETRIVYQFGHPCLEVPDDLSQGNVRVFHQLPFMVILRWGLINQTPPLFIENDDPVQMIWHDNEVIQFNGWKMFRYIQPMFVNGPSDFGQVHVVIFDLSENAGLVLRTNRYVIPPYPRVIPRW